MTTFGSDKVRDPALLLARILLSLLFLIFGWEKLTNYSGRSAISRRPACRCRPWQR